MKIVLALALLLTFPALAALRTAPASSTGTIGSLTTVTTDTVSLALRGDEWATAQFTATSAGTATATAQVSIDGGNNWIAATLCKKTSAVAANPIVQAISATTLTTADVWECPLPGNATNFRLQCGGSGTTTGVQVGSGVPYVPGVPVTAVLYDAAVTAGANNNTGTLDGSGWSALSWLDVVTTATTGTQIINQVDDAGTATAVASIASLGTGTYVGGLGVGISMGTGITPVTGLTQIQLPKRFNFALTGATTSAIRLRIEVRR